MTAALWLCVLLLLAILIELGRIRAAIQATPKAPLDLEPLEALLIETNTHLDALREHLVPQED